MPALAERGDRYELFGEIARGGMGAILKGRDADLGRDLAVKVLLEAHTDKPELLRRFVEEAQIGGQLQHPGIVPVYELGTFADRRPYFTMKLVKGRTLATLLGERGRVGAPSPSNSTPGADATGLAAGCTSGERGRVSAPSPSNTTPGADATGLAAGCTSGERGRVSARVRRIPLPALTQPGLPAICPASWPSSSRSRRRWPMPTRAMSFTATSSRRM